MKKSPRYNVVSVRLSDDEQRMLRIAMDKLKVNASDALRAALHQYAAGVHK